MKKNECDSLKIENIVGSGSIADTIDLETISNNIENCELNITKFPSAIYRMQDPKSAVLIFSSGKVVLTGIHNLKDLVIGIQNIQNTLKETGVDTYDVPRVEVTNIVCSYSLGNRLNLVKIMITFIDYGIVEYEPEVFPGLVFRIPDPKIVFLLFSSGKVIITGGRKMEDIKRGLEIFKEKISLVS
jgi:transcription initiation factor TFIID TATA-box-binding protein